MGLTMMMMTMTTTTVQQNGDQNVQSSIQNSEQPKLSNLSCKWTNQREARRHREQQQQRQLETISQRQANKSIIGQKLAHFQLAANGGRRLQLLLLLLCCNCIGAFEPDFVIPLENVTVAQGRDATFTCVVNNLGGHRVSGDGSSAPAKVAWIKADAKAILAIHEHVITNNDRLSVTHNDYNTWTLNIRSVKMEDAGKYMCQVNTDPMKMQTAVLEVVIPPDIVNEETSGDMMVPEGGSAKLVCRARGHPKPKITWRREDGREIIARNGAHQKTKAISVEGEMLTLSKVTRSEMGAYMCIASNGVPPTVSKRMKLQVHFHPLVQVPNQLVGAPVLTDVTLICNVEASPKAINYWQRENGEMIIAGDRYALTEKENNMYAIEMILHIRRLQTSDFGGYKCISKNSIGDTEGTIRLYEMERPGKKNHRDEELNEVTKNEVVLKENRHEDGSRNQNGRLYKDRSQAANVDNGAPARDGGGRTMAIVKAFLLAVFVLLTTKLCCNAKDKTCHASVDGSTTSRTTIPNDNDDNDVDDDDDDEHISKSSNNNDDKSSYKGRLLL